jgi:glyoxylase-like metal-dependent hydrolase (beta-lactamase superfamily II)
MTKPIILTYVLGPLENNSYVIADPATNRAAVIDPSFDSETMLADLASRNLKLEMVLLTHAHFDHIAGVSAAAASSELPLPVWLHPADLELFRQGGGGKAFGLFVDAGPDPQPLAAGQVIEIGELRLSVLHAPGHTPGHVIFYCAAAGAAFCGDVIFAGSVGRTDLPGGSHKQLIASIRQQVLTLPPETRLLSGHGPETTVAEEAKSNPYLNDY